MVRETIGLLTLVALVALGLGWGAGTLAGGRDDTSVAPVADAVEPDEHWTPTTSPERALAPEDRGGYRDEDGPLRVILAGDSVMAGLAPAIHSAVGGRGDVEIEFVLTPTILRDDSIRFSWKRRLERSSPDVVVMFVGPWELGEVIGDAPGATTSSSAFGAREWRTRYEQDVLDPWIRMVTDQGGEVIWLGAPVVAAPEANRGLVALNEVYRALGERWDEVRYVDTGEALSGDGGGYTELLTASTGRVLRIRQVDGLHLCPDGAVRLAEVVLAQLDALRPVEERPGWREGAWRDGVEYPAEACPSGDAVASVPS